jgi:hypothetical protein
MLGNRSGLRSGIRQKKYKKPSIVIHSGVKNPGHPYRRTRTRMTNNAVAARNPYTTLEYQYAEVPIPGNSLATIPPAMLRMPAVNTCTSRFWWLSRRSFGVILS